MFGSDKRGVYDSSQLQPPEQKVFLPLFVVSILFNVILGHDDEVTTESVGLSVAQKLVLRATPWKDIKSY